MKHTKEEVLSILELLDTMHPNAHCELNYDTPFELLVAVILSAQCTDKRVNEVSKELFKVVNTPKGFMEISQEKLEELIKPCGFYKNKAKHLKECSKDILEKYNGKVPDNMEDLITLSGVGRKTANVVMAEAFNKQAIAVDTHVLRVSNRIGFIHTEDPKKVEEKLMKIIPYDKWSNSHHLLIFLGRYTCLARKPKCKECKINQYCEYWRDR